MRIALFLLVVVGGAALDLIAKAWARAALEWHGPPVEFLPFVSLHLTYNSGISFGMLGMDGQAGRVMLIAGAALLTLGLTVWGLRTEDRWERLALSVIVAGALANLIDRAAYGVVTDFLDLHVGNWHPFIFNLADLWISAGVALLAINAIWLQPRHP